MNVVWHADVLEDWRRLNLDHARLVDAAVQRWASSGEGRVIFEDDEFRLFVGSVVVVFFVSGDTMHIGHVRSA
jgi:hypothetical protein